MGYVLTDNSSIFGSNVRCASANIPDIRDLGSGIADAYEEYAQDKADWG